MDCKKAQCMCNLQTGSLSVENVFSWFVFEQHSVSPSWTACKMEKAQCSAALQTPNNVQEICGKGGAAALL